MNGIIDRYLSLDQLNSQSAATHNLVCYGGEAAAGRISHEPQSGHAAECARFGQHTG